MLVAGVGNVLRGDDGFGVMVLDRLAGQGRPTEIRLLEVGIGGIHLVQELLADPVDMLIVVDAIEMGRRPGTVMVVEPVIEDVVSLPIAEKHDKLADMHYSTPDRALMLVKAMGALPPTVWVVGCEPLDTAAGGEGLSRPVVEAVPTAIEEIKRLVGQAGVEW